MLNRHEKPQTPAQRLPASPAVSQERREQLRRLPAETDPVAMRHEIDEERLQLLLLLRRVGDARASAA